MKVYNIISTYIIILHIFMLCYKKKKTQIRLQLMAENVSLVKIIIFRNLFLPLLYAMYSIINVRNIFFLQ